MTIGREWKIAGLIAGIFGVMYFLPVERMAASTRLVNALWESLYLVRWYAREHVLLCLVPAFFIAGAITVFVRKESVLRYLGPSARKPVAYGVASVSGTILAVCSCTILPLFAGISAMGAGIGPATTFLYSGPAINVLAIILTGRVLGLEIGLARAVGAVLFSVAVGLSMHFLFRNREQGKAQPASAAKEDDNVRPLWKNAVFFGAMVSVLVFANWGKPEDAGGFWDFMHGIKWYMTGASALLLAYTMSAWLHLEKWKIGTAIVATIALAFAFPEWPEIAFSAASLALFWITATGNGEAGEWFAATWDYTKQITPLLLAGVFVAGLLLGRPGQEGMIPSAWVIEAGGGDGLGAILFASIAGAFMYFATLTEVPILQGLIGAGMGNGPALALLLAGPALSLPSILVLRSIMGTRKTLTFIGLVIIFSTIAGLIYGNLI